MAVTCPDGHLSEATDYCDTCGLEIAGEPASSPTGSASPPPPPVPPPAASGAPEEAASPLAVSPEGASCPNCGTARTPDSSFCEVCGLDFASGELPPVPAAPTEADPASDVQPSGWTVTITADRGWYDQQEMEPGAAAPFPDSVAARTVDLAGDELQIGRRSERSGWYPEIDLGHPVDDSGVSRKHARLQRTEDGWEIVDTGSTNGTVLNDVDLDADEPAALADGDRINLGIFTRMTVGRAPGGGGAEESAAEAETT